MNRCFPNHVFSLNRNVRLALYSVILALTSFSTYAQSIDVTQANSNAEVRAYVEDVLLGSCVTVSNISYTGPAIAAGTFSGVGTTFGLEDGIILTTGEAGIAEGPDDEDNAGNGNSDIGDADLTVIASAATEDATVLEFDFIPSNDTLRFNYIFASEEYPEYVNGGYNDAFGFFVAGPGIVGPFSSPGAFPGGSINVALIPGTTTPVTIDNVNYGYSATEPPPGPPAGDNQTYYVDNSSGLATQYDGYTTVLTAEFVVVPCQTYHIKLAVADAGDDELDSGVFLEGGSFSAGAGVTVEIETTTIPPGISEGCADAWFIFRRVAGSDNSNAITAGFVISGTAIPNVDYTALPTSIIIPAGEDSILVSINASLDFITEGPESIIVTLLDPPCACESPASATVNIVDNDIPLAITTTGASTICFGQSANLTADPSGSHTPYTGGWNNGAPVGDNVSVSPTNTTTYTYTVIDNCGGQTVTSSETITVIRPDFTVDDDEQCSDGNSFSFANTGATGGSVTHLWDFGDSNSSNAESPLHTYLADGDYTVTHYIIFTASNCTADASAVVTVFSEPEITPTVEQEVICDGGTDGVLSTSVSGGTSGFTYSWSPGGQTTSSITGQGIGTYTVTVTDVNGCTDSDSETIIQYDPVNPVAVCQNTTVQLNGSGDATISATDINNGSSDNCGIASLVVSPNTFTCSELGANTVTLTVTDVNGNTDDCTAIVTVEDDIDPTAVCQTTTVQLDAAGNGSIVVADVDGGSSDNCSVTVTATSLTFDCSDVGANTVVLTATDLSSNSDDCNTTVTVQDTISPTAICQDITIQLDATGTASIVAADVDGGSTDNCGIATLSVDQTIFDCTQVGPNTVTLTVVDVNGNQSICQATVTVEDNVNPNANCQDITIYLNTNGDASILASDINVGSNSNCGVDTVFVNPNTFTCAEVGNNTVTLTVVDNNGNQSTCTANVEVLDTVAPIAICQDLTLQLDGSGQASTTATAIDNGSFDNCAIASLIINQTDFDCSIVGANTVTLTVTDANGNVSTCTSQIAIEDTISPNATCTPVVVQLDANGTATITPTEVDLNSSDNCVIDTMTLDQDTFDCSEVGTNTVTLTVTDVNGNSSTCTADIIVEENLPPAALCQDITVFLDTQGNASILPADVDAGSIDNCAIDTMYVTPNDFTCSGVGANPVVLTVIDVNGNVGDCNAIVTVNDTISPIAICQDITVQLDSLGNASINAEEIDNGSSDACGITGFTVDVSTFECSNVGTNAVVLTVTDVNSNTSTCSATVTIEDNINPIVNCLDLTVILDGNGTVNVSAGEFIDNSSDNCAIDTIFATQIDFSCADLGSNIITVTVIDVNGNTATCSSELTVLDTLSPVIIACPLDTVIVPDSSDCSPEVFWTEPTATDNCTPTLTSDFAPGDNFPVGTTTVTYTATDESNNSTTCSFDITIEPSTVVVIITSPEGPCGYNLSCSAFPNGEATANVSGGCLPYDYVWTDGQITQTAIGLAAGLYGVTVTDANGTSVVQTIVLTEPDPLTTDSLVSPEYVGGANISCNGEFDGALSINVLGGEECVTYDFVWTGPNGFTSTNEDLTGLEVGTYIVVVSDASGCSYTDSITLVAPNALYVDSLLSDYNGVNISCVAAADGAIDLTISGGATPYSVSWNNGEMTEDIDSLEAGTYFYTVVDANGCEITDSITLTAPIGLTSSITTSDYNGVNISCFGLADGSIDLTINDGTQSFSYLWNNNETTEDIDSLQAGTYIVSIIDANGCTLQDSVTLVEPDDIVINSTDTTIISCNGVEDGAFTVQAIGGVPTFTYTCSDGQTGPTAGNLGFGMYIVAATDINGCQDSISMFLTEPAILDASVVQATDVICFGESNGIIDVNVLGGTFPYTYDWSNDSTTQDLNGVPVGVYSLEVTDANGCTDTLSVSLDEPTQLTLAIDTVIDVTCSGAEDGEATVEASGGTAPYTYTWPNLSIAGPTASGLSAGVYEVQVVDDNGCLWSLNVAVGQPTSIEAQLDVQSDVSCNGLADGSALVTASGGSGPYAYLWSNSETDSLATGFTAGTHTVTVVDAGGCDTTLTFVIEEPSVIVKDVDTLYNLSCNGVSNGQAEVDVAGGTSPYNVTWSNSDVGYVADNLGAGPHTAYVTDGNGCLDSLTVVITEPDTLEIIQVSTTEVACVGGDDGEATVIAQGGTAPLTYNWPLIGQTGNTATNLEAGTYTFVVLDANGCTYTDTVQITEPEAISAVLSSDTAVCPGNGVTISASASGGSGNYSYSWGNGLGLGASHFVSPSIPTTYSVEAFDQSGCSSGIFSVTVDVAQLPVAAFTSSANAPCILPTDVEFTNTGSGATGYEWFLGNGTLSSDENPTATYDNAGTYTVTLIASSGAGCSDTTTATVIIDNLPVAEFTLDNAEGCAPLVVNFGNNSTTGLQYSWDFGDGNTSTISNPVHVYEIPGEYEVTLVVTGDGGCTDTVALGAAVSAYQSPIADFTPNNTSFPEPGNEYEFINNSNGADLYNWEFGNGLHTDDFQPTYDFPSYGSYFVTLTAINEFGCADTAVHYINVELFSSLHVPNAMAIGGIGESAIFIPKGTGIAEYHVWIFDNWGNQLWESTNLINGSPGEGWDGMYRGKVVPQGSYVWKINATFIDGEIWDGQDFSNGNRGNSGTVMVLH
jgi:PKD repeat protein